MTGLLDIKIVHDLKTLGDDARTLERVTAAAIADGGRWLQSEYRDQAEAAGLGKGVARAWRVKLYRGASDTAVLIYTRAPDIVRGFEQGARIRARHGGYLAIPTGFNRQGGRRGAKVLVTPKEMMVRGTSFVTPSKKGTKLWWYRVEKASRLRQTRKGGEPRLHRTGITDALVQGRRIRDRKRRELAVRYGAVPMFVLLREVKLQKRLDVVGGAERALDRAVAQINQRILT